MRFEKVRSRQYMKDFSSDAFYVECEGGTLTEVQVESVRLGTTKLQNRLPDMLGASILDIYDDIQTPKRATRKSAGYDFFAPYSFTLYPGESIKIATGIKVRLDHDKVLMIFPRSGHGFKARVQLDNTCGIIDADYIESSNEGHIMLKLTNDSHSGKVINVTKGEGFAQGIILQYYITEDDDSNKKRDGGLGSTNQR